MSFPQHDTKLLSIHTTTSSVDRKCDCSVSDIQRDVHSVTSNDSIQHTATGDFIIMVVMPNGYSIYCRVLVVMEDFGILWSGDYFVPIGSLSIEYFPSIHQLQKVDQSILHQIMDSVCCLFLCIHGLFRSLQIVLWLQR
jgi:hypothetical protein